uniref:Uncharacterized protein n=1 Tax=Babesia orientalis TaxID=273649 RepID=A0A0M5L3S9_9APIC|nr:hypothetical protein [Babesia orientalis]ALE29346.1 hypothetical protein [Babesia orientalis]
MNICKLYFKTPLTNSKSITKNLFSGVKKHKIRFFNISNMYYKKIYKTIKIFCSVLLDYDQYSFNVMQIKTVLFHKQSKEYVIIREYLNTNNVVYFFYK